MGVQDGSVYCRPSSSFSHTLEGISRTYPRGNGQKLVVAVDASIYIVSSLRYVLALQEINMRLMVPVKCIAIKVMEEVEKLSENGFTPILVFDGARDPLKGETTAARYKDLEEHQAKLEQMYADSADVTLQQIIAQQKKAAYVRHDIYYEVKALAEENGVQVIGSPFEADSQIIALANQNIIDLALTEDSDIPFQGMPGTIMRLSKKKAGNCCLATSGKLSTSLEKVFKSPRPITAEDISLFACLLGNDYIPRIPGNGPATCVRMMSEYVKLEEDVDKADWIKLKLQSLPEDRRGRFYQAKEHFHHGPAFLVFPKDDAMTAREAFEKGPEHYDVKLGSMSADPMSIEDGFWENELEDWLEHLRIGFLPSRELSPPGSEEVPMKDMFLLRKWSRTKHPLPMIPMLTNEKGEELCHGSMIDFTQRPVHLIATAALIFWLEVRGIRNSYDSSADVVKKVNNVLAMEEDSQPSVMPKFLRRGGGGYSCFEPLSPRGDLSVHWHKGDGMLSLVRSKFPKIDGQYFTSIFGKRNASRERCIKRLCSGAFDMEQLQVTTDLQSNLNPEDEVMVVKVLCTPSQKLGSGILYTVKCAVKLGKDDSDPSTLLKAPESGCDCPNGAFFCGHRGGLILLLYTIQKYADWDFKTLTKKMPEPIHLVVSAAIPVEFIHPRKKEHLARLDREIRKRALKAVGVTDFLEDSEDEDGLETAGVEEEEEEELGSDWEAGDDEEEAEDDEEESEDDDDPPLANPGMDGPMVADVATSPPVDVCGVVDKWIAEIEAAEELTGTSQRYADASVIEDYSKNLARPRTDDAYRKRQLLRLKKIHQLAERHPRQRSGLSLYCNLVRKDIDEALVQLASVPVCLHGPQVEDLRRQNV